MKRQASAVWQGAVEDGKGQLTTGSGALDGQPYSIPARFESEDGRAGTNPEELIAAAHAGCFAMATAVALAEAGHSPEELRANADLTLEQGDGGWAIRSIHLTLRGNVPGVEADEFRRIAEGAKSGCPVSKALSVDITLDAELES